MKKVTTNEGLFDPEGTIWVPDTIADWDAIHNWERVRLASMREHLHKGMTLLDVGTEHCWLTAVYGQFVGPENVVLAEPSPEMWQDIRYTWEANKFPKPKGVWAGFVGAEPKGLMPKRLSQTWPKWTSADADESPVVPYRFMHDPGHQEQGIPTITIDQIGQWMKVDAITVDVEGAEFEVMKGAELTLRKERPLVWLSVHPDLMQRDYGVEHVEELFDFMTSCGYGREYLGTDHEQHHFFATSAR